MVTLNRTVASVTVFTAAFFALSGAGAPIDPPGALLGAGALATLTLLLFAASARQWRTEARQRAHSLAVADAEGLMRMDTDKG
jgi:hypothetical protein